jgi:hypothetical protein
VIWRFGRLGLGYKIIINNNKLNGHFHFRMDQNAFGFYIANQNPYDVD